jgi:lysophospholipase L1-like esterase
MGYRTSLLLILFSCFAIVTVRAQSPSCSAASKFYSKDTIEITTFGASTVAGVNGFSFQPYLQQNFQFCYVGKTILISNYGIPGQTTTQGLARFPAAIAGKKGFVCILMGVNDILTLVTPANPNPTAAQVNKVLATAKTNMEDMIKLALAADLVPVIGTVQYITDKNNKALNLINAYIKRMNAIYAGLVNVTFKGKTYLADINAALGHDVAYFQADGLHPNAAGDKIVSYVWFDSINNAIENTLLLVGLNQNYPNPANSTTKIGFSLSQPGNVNIQLYNMVGALLKTLTNQFYDEGYQEITISVNDLQPGIYIYVMRVAGREIPKKMIVAR